MALVLVILVGPSLRYLLWRQVPATITITTPPGQFSKIEMGTEFNRSYQNGNFIQIYGEGRSLDQGRVEYPASYGIYFFRMTLADRRVITLSYPHYNAGVCRKVVIHVERLANDHCKVDIQLNGPAQGTVEFDAADTEEHRVPLEYKDYGIPFLF